MTDTSNIDEWMEDIFEGPYDDINMDDSDEVNAALLEGIIEVPMNAVFSPDGKSLLVKGSNNNIYITDAKNPVSVQKIVLMPLYDGSYGLLFTRENVLNRYFLQTKWLTNGNIAMNSQNGAILWEIITDGSVPNWQIGS